MTRPNTKIELSVDDMDLIEAALRERKATRTAAEVACDEARQIHDLLGKLHNQKVFFRPKGAPYVSG